MAYEKLNKDLIDNPQLWRLELKIESEVLRVVLYCNIEDNSLITRTIPLDGATDDYIKSIEDAIYDNPLLLSDFSRIDCVLDTEKFTIVPAELESAEVRNAIFAEMYPAEKEEMLECEIIANDLQGQNATLLMAPSARLVGFLRRTFSNCHIMHHLTPLCRYFYSKSKLGNSGKMYAHFRQNKVDLISFGKDTLRVANTFKYHDPMDAVYYILSVRKTIGMDQMTDELLLSGDQTVRETVTPILREYLAYVMPLIFPSTMFKAGKDALNAPFELITLPLCE
jgi:hypothetical protein